MQACVDGQNVEFLACYYCCFYYYYCCYYHTDYFIYMSLQVAVLQQTPRKQKNKAKRECTVNILYSRIAMIRNTKQTQTHTHT